MIACLLAPLAGCGLFSPKRTVLYDGPRGAILLEDVPQRGSTAGFRSVTGLRASHPIILEPSIILASLRGLSLRADSATSPDSANSHGVTPVFSQDDAQFLAPLIGTALSAATLHQYVIFRVFSDPVGSGVGQRIEKGLEATDARMLAIPREETAGALYVSGRALHITLIKYRVPLNASGAPDQGNASSTGLAGRSLVFAPAAAVRPDLSRRNALPLATDLPAVVVDYQALPPMADQPAPSLAPMAGAPGSQFSTGGAPTADEVRELKELVVKKDLELERLREEVRQLKQEKTTTKSPSQTNQTGKKPAPKHNPAP